MSDKPDPKNVAKDRLPPADPEWVRETAEAEIKKLREELATALAKIKELESRYLLDDDEEEEEEEEIQKRKKKSPPPAKKSNDWFNLGG